MGDKTDPEAYSNKFDLNQYLSQLEEGGTDIVVYARNAANAETLEEKIRWLERLDHAVDKASTRFEMASREAEALQTEELIGE